ncbi:deoxynucleotide monophosphate kinase [Metarhizobium album]|uniref:Deoxynucleotide monophosphate kinase n=1 Tax=Metarhizobium album TaxID=2182425 RepID=A0A2U2DSV6_9HYPH|nr:deoxynucleotide monophosphate kinase [Rhizobium album]PWE56394.1 deoxynucleotide monophosphate kinase [Rhizobium album]
MTSNESFDAASIDVALRPLAAAIGRPANDNYPPVIALTGVAGSGKSTAADYLIRHHGYERVKFATPLKNMMRAIGFGEEDIEGSCKELSNSLLCDKTPRHAMQTLGSQWGRDCIGEDFWVNLWKDDAERVILRGGRVVVDDCRFPNEASTIRKMGGVIYKLEGRGGIAGTHVSEAGCGIADAVIENDGARIDLYAGLEQAMMRWAA